jgi:hypothetical protein
LPLHIFTSPFQEPCRPESVPPDKSSQFDLRTQLHHPVGGNPEKGGWVGGIAGHQGKRFLHQRLIWEVPVANKASRPKQKLVLMESLAAVDVDFSAPVLVLAGDALDVIAGRSV